MQTQTPDTSLAQTQIEVTPKDEFNRNTVNDQVGSLAQHQGTYWQHPTHSPTPLGCPPPPYGAPNTIVVNRAMEWPPHPCVATCTHCGHCGITETKLTIGLLVWVTIGAMLLLGLWLGCCFIPLCIPSLKDVEHYCAQCGNLLGKKERMN